MKRSAFLGFALLGALGGLPAAAQQAGKTYRVGILSGGNTERSLLDAFRRTLAALGYEDGKNLEIIIYRNAPGNVTQLRANAVDLVRTKPDVIVAVAILAIAAAKRATTSVPIVMTQVSDPVGDGFVASLARPGGNITGEANINGDLNGKRVQFLNELVPHVQRIAVIRNPANTSNLTQWRKAESAARALGIQAFAIDIRCGDQIDTAFKKLAHEHADAIIVLPDALLIKNAPRIVRLVAGLRLATMYQDDSFIAAGGLMAYGASQAADWKQAATYVDRIFKGAKPADLPVERPTIFDLIVNLKTARALGITVPQSILLRATKVIR